MDPRIGRALASIDAQLHDQVSVARLAQEAGLSPRTSRTCFAITSAPPPPSTSAIAE